VARVQGRNVTLTLSRDRGQTWEELNLEAGEIRYTEVAPNRLEDTISIDPVSIQQRLNQLVEQVTQVQDRQRENYLLRYLGLDPDQLARDRCTLSAWRDNQRMQTIVEIRDVNGDRVRTIPVDDEQLYWAENSFRGIAQSFPDLGAARYLRWGEEHYGGSFQQPITLRWYSFHDPLRHEKIIGIQDESDNTTHEQRISETLLRWGQAPDVISRVTAQLGEAMLVRLADRGVSQERIELARQSVREHIYRGFIWGTPRRSLEEVSLCHCRVCDQYPRDTRIPLGHRQDIDTEAESRARNLLLSCLNPDQQEEYAVARSFTVKTKSGNHYRIQRRQTYNVIALDKKNQMTFELCAGPVENVLLEDQMLVQKLLLETDEAGFLALANRRPIAAYWQIP
jgi:hypothetical protein